MQNDLGGIVSQVLADVADVEKLEVGSFTGLCDVGREGHSRVQNEAEVFCHIGRGYILKADNDGGGGWSGGRGGTEFKYLSFTVIQFEFV